MYKFIDLDTGLPALLNKVKTWVTSKLSTKQDTINDLATIRSGAAAGATALQPADVRAEAPATPDGTFTLNVGSNEYTINLNHTHENMAKLVVCEEGDIPATLATDTIYAVVDDGSNPTEIETLYIAGLEFVGGGVPAGTPQLTQPAINELTMSDDAVGNIQTTVRVKAKNITGNVNVSIAGTGFSIIAVDGSSLQTPITSANSPLAINAADALLGVELTISYGGTSSSAEGTLVISSATAEFSAKSIDLTATGALPSGYTRLEYVDNAANGIKTNIDAGTKSGNNFINGTKWEIDVRMDSTPSSPQLIVCSTQDVGHWFGALSTGNFGLGNSDEYHFSSPLSTRSKIEIEFVSLGMIAKLNGTTISRYSTTNFNHWPTATGIVFKVCLFNDLNTANVNLVYKGRIYSVKCIANGSFDGVPALNTTTNKKGLYDRANNVFYPLES